MSTPTSLTIYLDQLNKSLNLGINSQNTLNYANHKNTVKAELFNCTNNYYGEVERNILLTKIKIAENIQKIRTSCKDEIVQQPERNILKTIRSCLAALSSDVDHLLKEGILTLYTDLCGIREHCSTMKISISIQSLLKNIIDDMANLLKAYFVNKQYQNRKNSGVMKENYIFSMKNLNKLANDRRNGSGVQQKLMHQVQQSMVQIPIQLLIEDYMKKQVVQMKEALEVCRICTNKIKLSNIEKHVKNCQKKGLLKQELHQKNKEIHQLINQLKQEFQLVSEKTVKTQIDQKFRKIAKLVLCSEQRRERNVIRRSSLCGVKSEKSIKDKMEKYIEQFLLQNGEHLLFSKILQLSKEKAYIEKRINSVQINNLNSDNTESDSFFAKNKHSPSMKIVYTSSSGPKSKSHVAFKDPSPQKHHNSNSSISHSQSSQSESEEELDSSNVLQMIKTKNSLTKKDTYFEVDQMQLQKHYVSLQDIPLEEQEEKQISIDHFQILKFLGEGAFGKVYMARRNETKDIYALKIIQIPESYGEKELQTIKNQHQIFKKIAGDHLVTAPFSFSQKQSHIFVLQYLPGGDLRKLLNDEVYFQQQKAKYYLAEIILAIEHLHKFGIIHRDLKPQNLVIDKNGHVKLTDFGLSQFQMKQKLEKSMKMQQQEKDIKRTRKRRTAVFGNRQKMKLIGTPDYIAPQIINRTSINNFTIDWWSLGVMAYEFLIGTRPFCADTIQEVIDNITNFNVEWPQVGYEDDMITPQAKDFICQLLNKDFMNRLGAKGADDIKAHPFLAGVDWQNIKYSKPPHVPKMVDLKGLALLQEDKELRSQVQALLGNSERTRHKFKLTQFVRFDLLGCETIQNVQKIYEQQTDRLKKLNYASGQLPQHKYSLEQ